MVVSSTHYHILNSSAIPSSLNERRTRCARPIKTSLHRRRTPYTPGHGRDCQRDRRFRGGCWSHSLGGLVLLVAFAACVCVCTPPITLLLSFKELFRAYSPSQSKSCTIPSINTSRSQTVTDQTVTDQSARPAEVAEHVCLPHRRVECSTQPPPSNPALVRCTKGIFRISFGD